MVMREDNRNVSQENNTKRRSSIKKKIIGNYIIVLGFMILVGGICIYEMNKVKTELATTQSIIDSAAVQAVTKQSMRASIAVAEEAVSKGTNISIKIAIIGFIVTLGLAIVIIRGILIPLRNLNKLANSLKKGDLTAKLEGKYDKE